MTPCNAYEKERRLSEMRELLVNNRTSSFVELFALAKAQLPWAKTVSQSSLYRYVFEVRLAEKTKVEMIQKSEFRM